MINVFVDYMAHLGENFYRSHSECSLVKLLNSKPCSQLPQTVRHMLCWPWTQLGITTVVVFVQWDMTHSENSPVLHTTSLWT